MHTASRLAMGATASCKDGNLVVDKIVSVGVSTISVGVSVVLVGNKIVSVVLSAISTRE